MALTGTSHRSGPPFLLPKSWGSRSDVVAPKRISPGTSDHGAYYWLVQPNTHAGSLDAPSMALPKRAELRPSRAQPAVRAGPGSYLVIYFPLLHFCPVFTQSTPTIPNSLTKSVSLRTFHSTRTCQTSQKHNQFHSISQFKTYFTHFQPFLCDHPNHPSDKTQNRILFKTYFAIQIYNYLPFLANFCFEQTTPTIMKNRLIL